MDSRGQPTGELLKFGPDNTDGYLAKATGAGAPARAAAPGVGLLIVPDVFGIWQNSKLLADQFAAEGYTTLLLDIFRGDALTFEEIQTPGFNLQAWIKENRHVPETIDPVIENAIRFLKEEQGVSKVGGVGYCFGAKYVVRHFQSGIDVGYAAHPSFVTREELGAITGPYSIAAAEIDGIFTTELRHESEEILKTTGQPWQINLFSGVSHGFATRCDLKDPRARWAKEQAFCQAVAWFDLYLR